MDDMISRQAAINMKCLLEDWTGKEYEAVLVEDIKQLPSAADKNVGTKLGTNLAEVGTDCISRQAAIDAFNTNLNELVVGGEANARAVENYLNRVLDKIKCLPSAQPKKGKWIIKDDTERFIAQCNCCRYIEDSRRINNFCPHCGADMKEVTT